MKIYTRVGDDGMTALFGGGRVPKYDARIQAIGALDELNAALGVVRTQGASDEVDIVLERLQNRLFDMGAELASPDPAKQGTASVGAAEIAQAEADIDHFDAGLAELKNFVLPGGSATAAHLHVARGVCRRAEREATLLAQQTAIRPELLQYLNRVGDLLFVLARAENAAAGVPDVPWAKD